jgi:hypothetical protein
VVAESALSAICCAVALETIMDVCAIKAILIDCIKKISKIWTIASHHIEIGNIIDNIVTICINWRWRHN